MSRALRITLFALIAVAFIGCGSATPASPDPTPTATSSPVPTPSAPRAPSSTASASATAIPVQAGEPWIVYEGPIPGGAGIRLVRPDGSGDHWATPGVPLPPKGWQVHPDWSPDGSRLAFATDDASDAPGSAAPRDSTRDIWTSRADGTQAERVFDCTKPCTQSDDPNWSPDGTTLAFIAYDNIDGSDVHGHLALLDVRTRAVRTVVTATDNRDVFAWPRWSPDGRRIVLETQHWSDLSTDAHLVGTTIGVVTLGDPKAVIRRLTDPAMWPTYPDWSPAGGVILFSTRPWDDLPDGPSNLYTIHPDGSGLALLPSQPAVASLGAPGPIRRAQPSWTPDGTRIIYTAVEGTGFGSPTMAVVNADGSGLASATSSGPMFGTHPRLRPVP